MNLKLIIAVAGLAALGVVLAMTAGLGPTVPSASEPVGMNDEAQTGRTPDEVQPTRTTEGGGIEVSATFMTPLNADQATDEVLVFKVALNAHFGDHMGHDVAELASLRADDGPVIPDGFTWEPISKSSHHRQGLLKLSNRRAGRPIVTTDTMELVLELADIGPSTRTFRWNREALSGMPASTEARMSGTEATMASSTSIIAAHDRLVDAVDALAAAHGDDPDLAREIAALANQVEQLRVLNPYYRLMEIRAEVLPEGVPKVYGTELGVSFDAVSPSIQTLAAMGPSLGDSPIMLTEAEVERYIRVGTATACQFCCEATKLVQPNGIAACACAHSQAMRGLAAYLITEHPDDYEDGQIVEELNQWRAAFFPKQTLVASLQEREAAGEAGVRELMAELPQLMPNMVGEC